MSYKVKVNIEGMGIGEIDLRMVEQITKNPNHKNAGFIKLKNVVKEVPVRSNIDGLIKSWGAFQVNNKIDAR